MKHLFFFLGTEAELIKIFPVMIECQKQNFICHVIASGQNDLKKSRILQFTQINGKYVELSKESSIKKSAVGLLQWYIKTEQNALKVIRREFGADELENPIIVVHGDTVSTVMGARIGKKLGGTVCHVEAGLRSHNFLNPFPEEIDRMLTSRIARVHFAPGDLASENLKKATGRVVNTGYNTILDSLRFSEKIPVITKKIDEITEAYFVFVMHRQENLANKEFVSEVMKHVMQVAETKKCVLILHKITENALKNYGLFESIEQNRNVLLMPRVDYFDFMKLLDRADFVITDGGSNQEELYYMGKPCLIMRKATERNEGIGQNAVMFQGMMDRIEEFGKSYQKYQIDPIGVTVNPSRQIAEEIAKIIK